jgi:hypothetical protein
MLMGSECGDSSCAIEQLGPLSSTVHVHVHGSQPRQGSVTGSGPDKRCLLIADAVTQAITSAAALTNWLSNTVTITGTGGVVL